MREGRVLPPPRAAEGSCAHSSSPPPSSGPAASGGGMVLPLSLLRTSQGHPMLVELKNGETYNGHLVSCDNWMNICLRDVICTSRDGDRFWKLPELVVRGNNIKYLRIPEEARDAPPRLALATPVATSPEEGLLSKPCSHRATARPFCGPFRARVAPATRGSHAPRSARARSSTWCLRRTSRPRAARARARGRARARARARARERAGPEEGAATAAAVVGARPAGAAAEGTIERTSRFGRLLPWIGVRERTSGHQRARRPGERRVRVRMALACVKYPIEMEPPASAEHTLGHT